jgi:hypothetical protein
MYAISLTTIPPRYPTLPRVLAALVAQVPQPDAIFLTVPRRFARFDTAPLPALPFEVTLLQPETDAGPIAKLLPAAWKYDGDILICDDDWLYPPGWAARFIAAREGHPDAVIAGSSWGSERIGYRGGTILQGFAGALVSARVARQIPHPPEAARYVDDVWISAQLARLGVPVHTLGKAAPPAMPLDDPGALQSRSDRDRANRDAAAAVDVWEKL